MHVDQARVERKGRQVFIRVKNTMAESVTVVGFTMRSSRVSTVRWTGDDVIGAGYETDLEFDMPLGRCGNGFTAAVSLTYRIGEGDVRQSIGTADDPYGNIDSLLGRDCAKTTLASAAVITTGMPVVQGVGLRSTLRLPVTLTSTGKLQGVRFGGYESTVLFRQAPGSPADVDVFLGRADHPINVDMVVVPSRCDPHALAEDKVGTLFGVKVLADNVADGASFYLPLTRPQRSAYFAFFSLHCGLD